MDAGPANPAVADLAAKDGKQVTTMRIANVAVNGSKSYGPRLLDWLENSRPNIVTLQKIGPREHFPAEQLGDLGYEGWPLWKQDGSDLGVAVLSLPHRSLPAPKVLCRELPGGQQRESRFLTVEIGDFWVSSVYAPYGPKSLGRQEAIDRRVRWLNHLRKHIHDKGYADRASLLCGDFNVRFKADGRPEGGWYSQKEEDALKELLDLGFCDLYRQAHCNPRKNPGRTRGYDDQRHPFGTSRLHLILASTSLARGLWDAQLDLRTNHRPRKDAPPLIVELEDI